MDLYGALLDVIDFPVVRRNSWRAGGVGRVTIAQLVAAGRVDSLGDDFLVRSRQNATLPRVD